MEAFSLLLEMGRKSKVHDIRTTLTCHEIKTPQHPQFSQIIPIYDLLPWLDVIVSSYPIPVPSIAKRLPHTRASRSDEKANERVENTELEIEVGAEKRRQPILTLCPPLDRLFLPSTFCSPNTLPPLPVSPVWPPVRGQPSPRVRWKWPIQRKSIPAIPISSTRSQLRFEANVHSWILPRLDTAFPSQLGTMIFRQVGRRSFEDNS